MARKSQQLRDLFDAPPPQNLELEREVLGELIVAPERVAEFCFAYLGPKDFHSSFHRDLFALLALAHREKVPIGDGQGVLLQWIADRVGPRWKGAGWAAELAEVIQHAGTGLHVEYQCRLLRRLAAERGAIVLATEALRLAYCTRPLEWHREISARLHAYGRRLAESGLVEDPAANPTPAVTKERKNAASHVPGGPPDKPGAAVVARGTPPRRGL